MYKDCTDYIKTVSRFRDGPYHSPSDQERMKGGGDSHLKVTGVLRREGLKGTKIFFCGRGL